MKSPNWHKSCLLATPRCSNMRIAVPIFGSRVSPRVDCASRILLVDVEEGAITKRWEESTESFQWRNLKLSIKQIGVNVMLCGGIRRCDFISLTGAGITVHPGLIGNVDDVLQAFLNGKIEAGNPDEFFKGNYGRRGRRWRGR